MILPMPENIETTRLLIRRLRYEEAEEIFYVYASKKEATRFVSWPTHETIRETRNFLNYAVRGWEDGIDYSYGIRLKNNGRFIGSFGILNDLGKVQFGYILGPQHWNNGYATEVCGLMMRILKTATGIYRISTFVDAENIASAKVLLKAGLKEEVRLEKWFRFVNQGNEPKDCILFRLEL